ncbi:MAG: secondary thiamine-phosphate synthase enzyme YjbQ [Candidatus Woesearchaeota archaeon]
MAAMQRRINVESTSGTEILDITQKVKDIVKESHVMSGLANVFTKHTTSAIRINENEPLLQRDLKRYIECIVPRCSSYNHDHIDERQAPVDEPENAHSHLKSLLLGASETIPVSDGMLMLGKWQSILFIELDGPKKREIFVNVVGE